MNRIPSFLYAGPMCLILDRIHQLVLHVICLNIKDFYAAAVHERLDGARYNPERHRNLQNELKVCHLRLTP